MIELITHGGFIYLIVGLAVWAAFSSERDRI